MAYSAEGKDDRVDRTSIILANSVYAIPYLSLIVFLVYLLVWDIKPAWSLLPIPGVVITLFNH
jgi:hypothetical protein